MAHTTTLRPRDNKPTLMLVAVTLLVATSNALIIEEIDPTKPDQPTSGFLARATSKAEGLDVEMTQAFQKLTLEPEQPEHEPETALARLQAMVLHGDSPLRRHILSYACGQFSEDPIEEQRLREEWYDIQDFWDPEVPIHRNKPHTWLQENGYTLMHACVELGAEATLQYLLTHGCQGREWIADEGVFAPSGYRRRWGVGLDMATDMGESPLMRAAVLGRLECAKLLLEHGARKDYRHRGGSTAAEGARKCKFTELADMIDQHYDERAIRDPIPLTMSGPEYVKIPTPMYEIQDAPTPMP